MAEIRGAAERISELRKARGETQAEFAKTFAVTQPMVSAWEAGSDTPPLGAYLRLGNLAPYPDNVWFWEQAGMDEAAMLSAAAKLLTERGQEPPEGKVIAVPPLRGGEKTQVWYVDARRVPNPGSVGWILWRSVERKILDTSASDSPNLERFWGKVVIVAGPGVDMLRTGLLDFGPWLGHPGGPVMPISEHTPWFAVLHPPHTQLVNPPGHADAAGYAGGHLGRWKLEMADYDRRLRSRGGGFDAALLRAKVREDLRLDDGLSILGIVIPEAPFTQTE